MRIIQLLLIMALPAIGFAQVKIGDPTGLPDPKAILELKDTTRGFLLPRMTAAHMNTIASPTDGLLIYNTSANSIYQYRATDSQWMPLRSDSAEWFLDVPSQKLYMRRGLAVNDSIYYNTTSRRFVFSDTRFFTGTSGVPFNMDEGNSDKFVFKVTASRFPRTMPNLNSANVSAYYEADDDTVAINNPRTASYTGIASAAVVSPSATQRVRDLTGINVSSGYAGQDSVYGVYGIFTNAYTRGNGFADAIMGQYNNISMGGTNNANVGELYGTFTNLTYVSPATSTRRVLGNIYGQFIGISPTLLNKVDGSAYGIFMPNVRASSSNNNFAIFTNKGHHHFGDSTVITDVGAIKARAVLDIVSSSAMILPVGITAQRPVTTYNGMLRFNSETNNPEAFGTGGWMSLKGVISATVSLDPPSIASGTSVSFVQAMTGVVTGNTVTISPVNALPAGIMIAWARVSLAGQIEVSFANISGAPVDLPAQNFYVKVVL
jgi:hypothetical protein